MELDRVFLIKGPMDSDIHEYQVPTGLLISEVFQLLGITFLFECGGKGRCGKCLIEISDDAPNVKNKSFRSVLACQTLVRDHLTIKIPESIATPFQSLVLKKDSSFSSLTQISDFSFSNRKRLGVAVDLGTTTICVALVDLSTKKILVVESRRNPQISFGRDVLSRIQYVSKHPENLKRLQQLVVQEIVSIIGKFGDDYYDNQSNLFVKNNESEKNEKYSELFSQISEIAIAGNTIMEYIFLEMDPSSMKASPFIPPIRSFSSRSTRELGFPFDANLFVFPVFSGFVGGDIVAGFLMLKHLDQFQENSGVSLYLDIGTNGEIILFFPNENDLILGTATAAGPAFEGAEIRFGMLGVEGAIESVDFSNIPYWLSTQKATDSNSYYRVIGNIAAQGICGSGLLDAIAELLRAKIILPNGRFQKKEFFIKNKQNSFFPYSNIINFEGQPGFCFLDNHFASACPTNSSTFVKESVNMPESSQYSVVLTQKDVRQVQLAVGAIRSGIELLLRRAEKNASDLSCVFLAGGFGQYLRRENIQQIGLLPWDIDSRKIEYCGNLSLLGAVESLFRSEWREDSLDLINRAEIVDLAAIPEFQDVFVQSLNFPDPSENINSSSP